MNDIWEEAWDLIGATFERIGDALVSDYPDMYWSSGHSDNSAFPFRAYATFSRGFPVSKDIVASVDFHRSNDKLRCTVDVGRDDGTVLADGPTVFIDIPNGVATAWAEIRAAIDNTIRFLEENRRTIGDAVNQ
jgi:hypothetical protein